MDINQMIAERRTIRRFKQDALPAGVLTRLVNAGRLAPSGANLQPLEFICVDDPAVGREVFKFLAWAGYISPAGTPPEGKTPTAYILVLVNTSVRKENYQYDVGASVENMILSAQAEGLGCCWIASINRPALNALAGIPAAYIVDAVLALGYPDESPVTEVLRDSCKYWKDAEGRLHVPKRGLEQVIHFNKF
ncbi:MAG: nitroreductase family protein [Candidatus Omnitrophica bacterium]|nr:nitroreductase family protein [Candidatus Omnitrophota bacterium]